MATALVCLALGSHESRGGLLVAGRWSPAYAASLAVVAAGGLLLGILAWKNKSADRGLATQLADSSWLVWGIAYCWATFVGHEPGSLLFSLRLFGSISVVAAILQWISLVLATMAGMIAIAPRLHGRWRDATLAVGSILVAALLMEGAFRVHTLWRPTTHGYNTYSTELWWRRYVTANSLGFRDAEPTLARTPGRRRIVLIGDSFAFGHGVDRVQDRFGEQLGSKLRERVGGDWEILNASLGNTHTLEHIRMLTRMLPYRPDLVVLLYVFNDADYLKPKPDTGVSGLPRNFRREMSFIAVLMRNSYMFQELYLRLRLGAIGRLKGEENFNDAYADSALVTRHLVDIERFVALARDGGAKVLIVPFDIGVVADERLRARDEHFVTRALAAGLPLCPITHAFDGHAFRSLFVNALDLHPNPYANALAVDAAVPCIARAFQP